MELYHHGIKGQKWGVRRFQRKDGSLTPAGEKRYSDSSEAKPKNEKSKRRLRLEAQYRLSGMSKQEAEDAAAKRIKAEKIVLAASAITLTACAAYYANKAYKRRVDQVVKAGESLQRIEMQDTNGKLYNVFYAAKGEHDSQRYKNLLGATRQQQTGSAYLLKLQAKSNVKVASEHNAYKAFKELYKTNPDFQKEVLEKATTHFNGRNVVKYDFRKGYGLPDTEKDFRKLYENFNSNLIDIRGSGGKSGDIFFDHLKKKGYGAIQDINDMRFSGYNAKNPLIFFDNDSNNIMVQSVSKISEDLQNAGLREYQKAVSEGFMNEKIESWAKTAGVYGSAAGGIGLLSGITSAQANAIADYKMEHPGTRLTDDEILKMIKS